jgi:sugar/nucleoside kinase (ribokinase family)
VAWEICVAGSVTLDDVTTPHGHRTEQQGGSAVYFALAAAAHATVHLVGVVGDDGASSARSTLDDPAIDSSGLLVRQGPTFRWKATHDFERWVTACEESRPGVYEDWQPTVPTPASAAEVLFLGSMPPRQQLSVLGQSRARIVGADSMAVHIGANDPPVQQVAEASDVLFLNRSELSLLVDRPEDDWQASARDLCGRGRLRLVVVKAGPLGAACVSADRVLEREAHAVSAVVDPTGAGDSLAGGFLGACARRQRHPLDMLDEALDAGLRSAAAAITAFGPDGLRRIDGGGLLPAV